MSYAADYAGLAPRGIPRAKTYELLAAKDGDARPWGAIRCLRCGLISHNPSDVGSLYCGCCHKFHEE
jgi:hypothetical protein